MQRRAAAEANGQSSNGSVEVATSSADSFALLVSLSACPGVAVVSVTTDDGLTITASRS